MKQEKVLKRLTELENEAKELRKIIQDTAKPFKITDVKTWEDVCRINKIDSEQSLPFPKSSNDTEKNINAYFMIIKIVETLNNGWEPNWNDSSQAKYYPYFDMRDSSGFGFSGTRYAYWHSYTGAGSRLCFRDEKTAEYAGKQFLAVYEIFFKK